MKRIMMLLVVAMLLLGVSGQAMAYFTAGDLIQVVYKAGGTGNEVLTDLGNASAWTTAGGVPTSTFTTGINDAFVAGNFAGASWDQLNVAYFTYTGTGNFWMSGPAGGQTNLGSKKSGTRTAMVNVMLNAAAAGTAQVVQSSLGTANSYWNILDGAGLKIGTSAGFVATGSSEANLAALASGGSADLYLYYYPTGSSNTAGTGAQLAKLTISNGSTHVTTAATPIPATFLLFGSGLLGLVGIRRKQTI